MREYLSLINTAKEYIMKESKVVDTRISKNLHVVFTINPLSPDFSNTDASSPALYNRCVIDWFGDW